MLQQGLRGACHPQQGLRGASHPLSTPRTLPQQGRPRLCQVVQVSDATTAAQELAPPTITWGQSMAQGPRPSMEDELRLEENCKNGVTYAGDP